MEYDRIKCIPPPFFSFSPGATKPELQIVADPTRPVARVVLPPEYAHPGGTLKYLDEILYSLFGDRIATGIPVVYVEEILNPNCAIIARFRGNLVKISGSVSDIYNEGQHCVLIDITLVLINNINEGESEQSELTTQVHELKMIVETLEMIVKNKITAIQTQPDITGKKLQEILRITLKLQKNPNNEEDGELISIFECTSCIPNTK